VRGRSRPVLEERVAREVDIARLLEDGDARAAFYRRMVVLAEASVASARALVEGDYHRCHASRGERWSNTYNLRRAEANLAEYRAVLAALEEAPRYDAEK